MRFRACSGGGGLVGPSSSRGSIYKNQEGACRDHGERGHESVGIRVPVLDRSWNPEVTRRHCAG